MELQPFKREYHKIFEHFANKSGLTPAVEKIMQSDYIKLFGFFLGGESFYFTQNHFTKDFEFVSPEVEPILGYHPSDYNVALVLNIMHPEDRPYFLDFGNTWIQFTSEARFERTLNYKLRLDIRLKKKNGDYSRMLYQAIAIEHDEQGNPVRNFGTFTDITYLKEQGPPTLSFIGRNGAPSFVNVPVNGLFLEKDTITQRERQVLRLLAEGRLSKEIAFILNISKETVDKHRKNMLRKKQMANTGELVSHAIRYGWI